MSLLVFRLDWEGLKIVLVVVVLPVLLVEQVFRPNRTIYPHVRVITVGTDIIHL
jgi:hypothetical protein